MRAAILLCALLACADPPEQTIEVIHLPPPAPFGTCPLLADDLRIVQIGSHAFHGMYALRSDGSIWCWSNDNGLCSPYESDFPVPAPAPYRCISSFYNGYGSYAAITGQGKALLWGQLGLHPLTPEEQVAAFAPAGPLVDLAVGGDLLMALDRQGQVWFFGRQRILPGWDYVDYPEATVIPFSSKVVRMFRGTSVCALLEDGGVECLGGNLYGEFGLPPSWELQPVRLPVDRVVDVGSRVSNTICLLRDNGEVWCAGDNTSGILGEDEWEVESRASFALVPGLPPAQVLRTRSSGACVIAGGEVWCWGGPPFPGGSRSPSRYSPFDDVVDVAVDGASGMCLVRADQTVWCNGYSGIDGRCGQEAQEWLETKFEPCEDPGF